MSFNKDFVLLISTGKCLNFFIIALYLVCLSDGCNLILIFGRYLIFYFIL